MHVSTLSPVPGRLTSARKYTLKSQLNHCIQGGAQGARKKMLKNEVLSQGVLISC